MTGALRSVLSKSKPATSITETLEDGGALCLTLQQVRANLTRVCNGKRPVVVGNRYKPRAIILPFGQVSYISKKETAELLVSIRAMLADAAKLL